MSVAPTATTSTTPGTKTRRIPLRVLISAWAAPLMVVGDFALLAVVPVALVLYSALRDPRVRFLRWPAGLLAAVYATPLALYLLNPNRPESLSKDIDPVFVILITAASAVVLLTLHTRKR